jgi:hypothetical protein
MRVPPALLALALSPALAACGGGGGGEDDRDEPKRLSVPADVAFGLGTVYSGGYVAVLPEQPFLGDTLGNADARVFVTFALDALRGSDLDACRLRIVPSLEYGDAEATPLHGFVAEPVDVGAGLDGADHAAPADLPPSARATRVPVAPGTTSAEFDVLAHVRAALLAGRSRLTLRLRVLGVSDLDGQPDGLRLHVADPGFGSLHPTLEATTR